MSEFADATVNAETMCALLVKIAALGLQGPITLVLDNARFQHCAVVMNLAQSLNIHLEFLPSYSPNRDGLHSCGSVMLQGSSAR